MPPRDGQAAQSYTEQETQDKDITGRFIKFMIVKAVRKHGNFSERQCIRCA